MNLGKGFPFYQENGVTYDGDPLIPVTPQKPVMGNSNPSPVGMQGNQTRTDFPELLGSCSRLLPEKPLLWRSNPTQSSELQVNQVASSSLETTLRSRSKFLPEKPLIRSSNSMHAEMHGNHIESAHRQKTLRIFSMFSPAKQVTSSSDPIATAIPENQTESTNWQDLLGVYSDLLQQTTKTETFHGLRSTRLSGHGEPNIQGSPVLEANGCFNYNGDSYLQNFGKDIPIRNGKSLVQLQGLKDVPGPLSADQQLNPTNKLLTTSSNSPVGNIPTEHQSASTMLLEKNQTWDPNQGISICSLQEMPSDAVPIPCQPSYNLNLPLRTGTVGASCTTNCFPIAPLTPDQGKQLKNHQLLAIDNNSVDGSQSQEKDKQEIISTGGQEVGNLCDQLVQRAIASPPPFNPTSLMEGNVFEVGDYGGIDLNKTPHQKPPKRKKHRPKVVVEGKPKRTPKPTPSRTKISNETPLAKRKYVRRKGRDSNSQQHNETKPVEASIVLSAAKSCRRVLNFDIEEKMQEKGQGKAGDNQPDSHHESFDLNLTSQGTISSVGLNRTSMRPTAMVEQQMRYSAEKQSGSTCNLINVTSQKSAEKLRPLAPIVPPITAKDHTLNVIARTINLQNAMQHQSNNQYGCSQVHQQIHGESMGQMPLLANTAWAKLDRAKQLMLQTGIGSAKGVAEANEKRVCKRANCSISDLTDSPTVNLMHLQFIGEPNDSRKTGIINSETPKKMKFEDKCQEAPSSMPSCTATVKHSSRTVESRGSRGVHVSSSPHTNGRLPYSHLEIQNSSRKQINCTNGTANGQYMDPIVVGNNFQEQRSLSDVRLQRECMAGQFLQQYMESYSPSFLIGITDWNMQSPSQKVPVTTQANETRTLEVNKVAKSQIVGLKSSILALGKEKVLPKDYKKEPGYLPFSKKARGQNEEKKHTVKIDEIICQLKGLQLSNNGQSVIREEQTALIPYKGDGTLVPYKGLDPIRRRKPRPKVDLDPETNRLWNVLMATPGSESTETMDKDKENWWEKEREVFNGRVDSFIARMHLVQGDRRFSRWKGSVVDSVIGVFLTQNVSDHLSSSAFMSLAAEFPLPRTSNPASAWIEEPEVQIIDPDGTITYHGRILTQSYEQHSFHLISDTGVHLGKENNGATEEEVFSSQNSSESLILQANEDVQSSSDSEVEDQGIMCNDNKSRTQKNILQSERAASLQQHQSCEMRIPLLANRHIPECQKQPSPVCMTQNSTLNIGSDVGYPINSNVLQLKASFAPSGGFWFNKTSEIGVPEPYSSGTPVKHSFSLSVVEATKTPVVAHGWRNVEHIAGNISGSTTQTGIPSHALTMSQNTCPTHQVNLQPGSYFGSSQQCISNDQEGSSKSFQPESVSETEARRPDGGVAQRQTGHMNPASEPLGSESTKIPNLRKRKSGGKTISFDWDTLRKQVLSKGGKQKRGKNTIDSMNYEALRNADVKKISETIKERGMNNMLADRIKDFLDRLVRDHGSIDLEWLRDVPPDKAKEYLLSIRGLGLKSVECVRLLTLHHMAFPVDTNVGRIAVRLGWVPLQPLPEQLQLHLLELYPVLESIQKYLWPRLCKLDQRTLYELHYQMITFGKVFCTKKQPNCNSCPMQPECRHYASAYASARLALPGPEERSIVSSAIPMMTSESPTHVLKPMALPPPETNAVRESQYIRNQQEPIIEEPSTPESCTEFSASDIEDLLSKDTDEMPTLGLSFEESKMNVQTFKQKQNMEIPEGDLSRALVALNPADASNPAPKLKNVNRLRTEHLVYEIPDSHPLLEGVDRREPDDPSPYLLAIWTPGETENSTQPPESKCSFQGTGRLCNEKTCLSCNSIREANSETVRGTLLIPCRTAMRGSFPLNGTYFQVNEVFADHESSVNPIVVPRDWLWPLPRRTVYCGTSVTAIFRGLSTIGIQKCFWRGYVCVRGFDRRRRAPRPLRGRLHYSASKKTASKKDKQKER